MEEFFEVLCWGYLGLHPKPIGLLNVAGYYDLLIAFIDRAMADGFLEHHDWRGVRRRSTSCSTALLATSRAGL